MLIGRKLLSLFKCPIIISSGERSISLLILSLSQSLRSCQRVLEVLHVTNRWLIVSVSSPQSLHLLLLDFPIWLNSLFVPRILWIILYWKYISLLSFIVLKQMWKILFQVWLSIVMFNSLLHFILYLLSDGLSFKIL